MGHLVRYLAVDGAARTARSTVAPFSFLAAALDHLDLRDQLPPMPTLLQGVIRLVESATEVVVYLIEAIALSLFDQLRRNVITIRVKQ